MNMATTRFPGNGRPVIEIRGLAKTFERGRIPALNGANLEVDAGKFVAIMGPSGCGKSTLLHLIAALDRPDKGQIVINGRDLGSGTDLNRHRARGVGLVFQLHNLLPTLSASENVQVPMFETGRPGRERRERALQILGLVGLADQANQRQAMLSGGERQRIAVARALANDPPILLADEPTGSLDSDAGKRILDQIDTLRRQRGLTVVLVTHDPSVAARADRIVRMLDGHVVDDGRATSREKGHADSLAPVATLATRLHDKRRPQYIPTKVPDGASSQGTELMSWLAVQLVPVRSVLAAG